MSAQQVGRYQIIEELGRGGMAVVYRAFDPRFRRNVALKILPAEFHDRQEYRARFEREALAIASLEHRAIVPVHDYGEADGRLYLVMRLINGGTLADRTRQGPLALDEAARILNRIAPALDYAHRRGIIHRDLKPANILFDDQDAPYLTDFGIVKLLQDDAVGLTDIGHLIGTPKYMSPEQAIASVELNSLSDIYSIGVILFEMLTGRAPYEADTPLRTALMHINAPIPDIGSQRLGLPLAMQGVINRAMAKDAADRFPNAAALAAAVQNLTIVAAGKAHFVPKVDPTAGRATFEKETIPESPSQLLEPPLAVNADLAAGIESPASQVQRSDPATAPSVQENETISDTNSRLPESAAPWDLASRPAESPARDTSAEEETIVEALPDSSDPESPAEIFAQPVRRRRAVRWFAGLTSLLGIVGIAVAGALILILIAYLIDNGNDDGTVARPPTAATSRAPTPAPSQASPSPAQPSAQENVPGEGEVRRRGADQMSLRFVNAGTFLMGSVAGDTNADADELPQHAVSLDAFWIDQTEVTNAQYELCVDSGNCRGSRLAADRVYNDPHHPVVGVSWFDATAYCEWVGGRLPTEAEWEYAARGPESRRYPWGNELPACELAEFGECFDEEVPSGAFSYGESWVGVLDIAGSVWEWVHDWWAADYYEYSPVDNPSGPTNGSSRVIRGGSYGTFSRYVRSASRGLAQPDSTFIYVGFRCASSKDTTP